MVLARLLISLLCFITTLAVNWKPVEDVINTFIRNGSFPGAVLSVANEKQILYSNAFGHFSPIKAPFNSPTVSKSTFFDIASLTKVTATLSVIMQMYQNKNIALQDKVAKYIPQFGKKGKQAITIQNLLLHNSGLAPDAPITRMKSKEQVMAWVYECKLDNPIGTNFVYSDLSFILLGQIAQRVLKKPLKDLARERMISMQMFNSTYLPPKQIWHQIAPTEYSPLRKQLIRGVVHDPTAYLFGGVAGHAGFFSTANQLALYMQVHLNKGKTPTGKVIYSPEVVQKFYSRVDGLPYTNRRALGWDTVPISDTPPCGKYFSLNSFGHTGFTGTMAWADRDKKLIIILLTNRVHPTSFDAVGIKVARWSVSNKVVEALGLNQNK